MNHPPPRYSLLFDLFVANGHVRTLLGRTLAEAPLRADQYAVYSVLFENGPTGPTELSRILGLPPTTISDYVRTMVGLGHAERSGNEQDQRSYTLRLTPAGRTAHGATSALFEHAMRAIEEHLTVEPATVRRSLQALAEAARRSTADHPRSMAPTT